MLRWVDDHRCVLKETTFELKDVEDTGSKDPTSDLVLLKPRWMIERYVALANQLRSPNVVELGIHRGGSTAFLTLLLNPRKLVAMDIQQVPAPDLVRFVERLNLEDSVRAYYGIDQSDRSRLGNALDTEFGTQELDLVIDDASHLLRSSTLSFNLLYPRLRRGGWFVLEDWSADHAVETAILRDPDVLARLEMNPSLRIPGTPMSRLVLEIVLGAASSPDVFAQVDILQGWVAVRRGPAPLDWNTFDVGSTYGPLGRDLLHAPREPS
jgi:hypothetical protein